MKRSTKQKGNKMYKITVYNSWTGENLFVVYRHTEEEAERCANYWWKDNNGTRSTWVKVY